MEKSEKPSQSFCSYIYHNPRAHITLLVTPSIFVGLLIIFSLTNNALKLNKIGDELVDAINSGFASLTHNVESIDTFAGDELEETVNKGDFLNKLYPEELEDSPIVYTNPVPATTDAGDGKRFEGTWDMSIMDPLIPVDSPKNIGDEDTVAGGADSLETLRDFPYEMSPRMLFSKDKIYLSDI